MWREPERELDSGEEAEPERALRPMDEPPYRKPFPKRRRDWELTTLSHTLRHPVKRLRCSDHVLRPPTQDVLFVGAERPDEFADALRMALQGHYVTVVNPRVTEAASAYIARGGRFIQARIEELPLTLRNFNRICENYPYPSARQYESARVYALARLAKLAPDGCWIIFTEHPGFASALRAVAERDEAIRRDFTLRFCKLTPRQAPLSTYLRRGTRFRLIFERRT